MKPNQIWPDRLYLIRHGESAGNVARDAALKAGEAMIDIDVRDVDVPLYEAVAMATLNPANAVGLKSKGRLEAGADGDLVVLSPELNVLKTFLAGREIYCHNK